MTYTPTVLPHLSREMEGKNGTDFSCIISRFSFPLHCFCLIISSDGYVKWGAGDGTAGQTFTYIANTCRVRWQALGQIEAQKELIVHP